MKLERITLKNFRQYYGQQRLTFSKDSHRNVTVINGINGAGKTSIFLAINWCLYGEGVSNVGELMSKEAISQAQDGDTVNTLVDLSFSHNGERFLVSRQISGEKQPDASMSFNGEDNFTLMRIGWDGQAKRVNNPIGTINAILPSNVRTYFLFDGEKINNFAKPEASGEVRYAIYNVLKLEVLTRGRKHLGDIASEYRRELKRISTGELRNLIEREEQARVKKEKAIDRRAELDREIESAREKIDDIDRRMGEIENARTLQQRREQIEKDLSQRQMEMSDVVSRIREIAIGNFIVIAQPAIDGALAVLNEKRERGDIPSNIRQQFVQDLIDQMECICGRSFELGSLEHDRLLALMNSSLPGSLEDDVTDTSATLRLFAEQRLTRKENLNQMMRQRTQLIDRIQALEEELDDVSRQLKGSPQEDISRLEKQRQRFQDDIEDNRLEQGHLDTQIETLGKDIAQLDKEIEQAKKDESKQNLLTRKASLAQRAADAIDATYQTFADETRKSIETKTKEIFEQLIWKGSHFQDIQLGSDYKLEVIDRYGTPARPELSAGERQVLSLSFITAMSRVSEEEAPLVIDTPLGRLSSHHRNSITARLPELTEQLILFVTDEELRDQARENLEPRIGAEYRLEFDQSTSCTEIIEVS